MKKIISLRGGEKPEQSFEIRKGAFRATVEMLRNRYTVDYPVIFGIITAGFYLFYFNTVHTLSPS